MKLRSLLVLPAALLMGSASYGAQIFFSSSATFANGAAADLASNTVPVLNFAAIGAPAQSLFLWAKVSKPSLTVGTDPDTGDPVNTYTPTESLVGMGLDVVQQSATVGHGNNFTINNFAGGRWNGPPSSTAAPNTAQGEFVGATGNATLARFKRVAVGVSGMNGVVSTLNPAPTGPSDAGAGNILSADGNFVYERFATIPVVPDAGGTSQVFLKINDTVVGYGSGDPNTPVFLGPGDPSVRSGSPNAQSQLADATITVVAGTVPEPTSLGLLGVAGFGLIRRRKA